MHSKSPRGKFFGKRYEPICKVVNELVTGSSALSYPYSKARAKQTVLFSSTFKPLSAPGPGALRAGRANGKITSHKPEAS